MRILLVLMALGLAGCVDTTGEARPRETVAKKVARGRAAEVELKITMPAGELSVAGGAADLLDGTFRFAGESGRPDVEYDDGVRGRLTIQPLKKDAVSGNAKWELRLADGVPFDVNLNMGAGQADLQLGSLDVRRVSVNGGAGDLTLDLRGKAEHDYPVYLNGGVGRVRIYVPGSAGVRARISGGIGGVDTEGNWTKSGREYKTQNYEDARRRIDMHLNGGIGTIKLIAVE